MKKALFLVLLSGYLVLGFHPGPAPSETWDETTPLSTVLKTLGDEVPMHAVELTEEKIRMGRELVTIGRTTGPDGNLTKRQSKHFLCTDCHNLVQEDPDLRESNPETRLPFTIEKDIPFLQGTTFFGIVNRESWYNDDYYYKYGSLVEKARNDLKESIQLCSTVCSQGRYLKDWELEAVLAYLWSLEIKLGDLDLKKEDWEKLKNASKSENKAELLKWVKTFYLQKSPAHFGETPENKEEGYAGLTGNPETGAKVYQQSCMTCHAPDGPSNYLTLGMDNLSTNFFKRNITASTRYSVYEIVRHGTGPIMGHDPYMPHYPLERMSNQQVEDLRAFMEQGI